MQSKHEVRTKDEEASSGEGTVDPGQKEAPSIHVPPVASDAGSKRCRKQKGSKNKRNGLLTPGSNDGDAFCLAN